MSTLNFPRPTLRTLTRRKALAAETRRRLSAYSNRVSDEPNEARTMDLLWAIARLEQVLALETGGQFGDPYASPSTVLRASSRRARIERTGDLLAGQRGQERAH